MYIEKRAGIKVQYPVNELIVTYPQDTVTIPWLNKTIKCDYVEQILAKVQQSDWKWFGYIWEIILKVEGDLRGIIDCVGYSLEYVYSWTAGLICIDS